MFVRKSTHDAVLTELSGVKAENQRLKSENDSLYRRGNNAMGQADYWRAACQRLSQELATTYVRDSKGRMARHPSAAK